MDTTKILRGAMSALAMTLAFGGAWAEAPSGYYSTCEGKKGAALLTALCDKISSHTNVGYDGLWTVYKTSDVRPNGKVWDMYSTKEWTPGQNQCGNYKYVGDCYNREHSLPKSWFSEAQPMKSDAFHVYPTDGKVNGQRSNYPYGECAGGTTLPSNGSVKALGRLGKSTFPGYSGTVFEPVDEYKGDFARTYFYMAACYNDKIKNWNSDMLAHNSYPVFTSWSTELLLKWHRQDPVSQKELDRNEAVYARQHNRNPFIDHPDMAEHIWGTDKDVAWSSTGTPKASIATPANGSTIDLGITGIGVKRQTTVTVKGQNLTDDVRVTVSGTGFSAANQFLASSAVNSDAGAQLTVSFSAASEGTFVGTLNLVSGSASSSVKLLAETVEGLPVLPATDISETGFTARWISIDPAGTSYTLHLQTAGEDFAGYPRTVDAAGGSYAVTGLVPSTAYTYWLVSPSGVTGNKVNVTTSTPQPSIQFLFDGDLYFTAEPGMPSEAAELLMDAENTDGTITLSVNAPFELSLDKNTWAAAIAMPDEGERFYARLGATGAGSYSSSLTAKAGTYVNDDVTLEGTVSATASFCETFENPSKLSGYNGGIYDGNACQWNLKGALIGNDPRDRHNGSQGLRTGKSSTAVSYAEMAEPKSHGAGTVSFFAKAWSGEGGNVELSWSTDGGISWTKAETFAVSDDAWKEYTAILNISGDVRIRLSRTSGGRIAIDDITVSDYALTAVTELEYHSWDAFCLGGALRVEAYGDRPIEFTVTSANGAVWHREKLAGGSSAELPLPAGVYLVTSGGFTRKTVVF